MNTGDHTDSNPFADPSIGEEQERLVENATLSVGRNASLTLGTDSLIVLGRAASTYSVVVMVALTGNR